MGKGAKSGTSGQVGGNRENRLFFRLLLVIGIVVVVRGWGMSHELQ
jgi:hypothetical protein